MTVTVQLSAEIEAFVRAEVAQGAAADEAGFLVKTVGLYRELKTKHDDLRTRVQESIGEYERGEVTLLDTNATKAAARQRRSQNGPAL